MAHKPSGMRGPPVSSADPDRISPTQLAFDGAIGGICVGSQIQHLSMDAANFICFAVAAAYALIHCKSFINLFFNASKGEQNGEGANQDDNENT